MILMFLNGRGLASSSKNIALKRLIEVTKSDVLMIQEITSEGERFVLDLEKLLGGWDFCFINAKSRSRGLLTSWRSQVLKNTNTWAFDSRLVVDLHSHKFGMDMLVLDIYRPYSERIFFLENLFSKGFMKKLNLIMGGDLNFSL
jgi:hypothetical protein